MARWTDLATWQGPAADNFGDGDWSEREGADRMSEHRGLVIHIAEGSYAGTVAWERNASSDISSHWVLAKDGRCAQMVDTDDRPWTQADGNSAWLSVECEGYAGDSLTPQQLEVVAQLLARANQVYGVPLQLADSPSGRGLGWHGIGGAAWGGHTGCPGAPIVAQRGAIVARAQEIINGGGTTMDQNTVVTSARSGPASLAHVWLSTYDGVQLDLKPALQRLEQFATDETARDGVEASTLAEVDAAVDQLGTVLGELAARPPVQLTDAQAQQLADQILAAYGARLDAIEAGLSVICGAMSAAAAAQLAALGAPQS